MDSAQSGVETAYATLMASLGQDAVPNGIGGQTVPQLAETLRNIWESIPVRASDEEGRADIHAASLAH